MSVSWKTLPVSSHSETQCRWSNHRCNGQKFDIPQLNNGNVNLNFIEIKNILQLRTRTRNTRSLIPVSPEVLILFCRYFVCSLWYITEHMSNCQSLTNYVGIHESIRTNLNTAQKTPFSVKRQCKVGASRRAIRNSNIELSLFNVTETTISCSLLVA